MAETINQSDSHPDPPNASALFQRRIEFHLARKPFKGFNNGGSDFKLETLNPCSSSDAQRANCSPGSSAVGVKKNDSAEFYEHGLDPELSFGITFRRIGAGLENLGNTCFLNSVLQCLTYTEPLAAYLQSGKHKSSCHVAGFCALCAIQNHVSRALQSTGRILVPKDLVSNLRCISRNFRIARQEDAHEYMVNLLESMHKCCLPSGVPSESPGAYEKSLVHKIFGGRLRSQVKCQQCSNCSNKFDPFLDLSLEIFKADSLHKALVNFTAAEWLDGGEKQYQCQRCKQKVRALKQLTIDKAPYVLTIHLKRFHSHDPGRKINKKVQFGCALDLKPFVSGCYEGDLKYSLYGVLVHSGYSTHSGHYYCYVRTSNNMWYTLDDNRVYHASEREVLNQQAYMLFYVRDQKNIFPRKPVDLAQKENMKLNVNLIKASTFNQGFKELVPNGPAENRSSGAAPSSAEAQKNILNVDSSKVYSLKDVSVQQSNSLVLAKNMMQKKESVSEPSMMPLPKEDSLKGVSPAKFTPVEQLSSLGQSGNDCSKPQSLKNLVASSADSIKKCGENEISKEDMKSSLSMLPSVSGPQNSSTKLVTNETSHKNNVATKVDVAAPGDPSNNISIRSDPTASLIQPMNKNSQAGASANGSLCNRASALVGEKAVGDQGSVHDVSVNKTSDMQGLNHKPLKKSKKKLLKCRVSSLPLSSSMFFMASLGLRKRKKHKRIKKRTLNVKNLNKKQLGKHVFLTDLEPSTPGEVGNVPLGSGCSLRGAAIASSKHVAPLNAISKSMMENITNGEFKKRIDQGSAVLATAKQAESISGSNAVVVNKCEARQSDNPNPKDGQRDQMHNGLMSVLTEKTVVARWDDLGLPPSQSMESGSGNVVSIGYNGDEWDEEYDQGKRKKLRKFKHSFGGPNLFQEVATKKSQFKRAKVDQSSSGNTPFRI
ncbi:hypothetical protein L6164_011524 [Bauhinia variegata]|uniref:Uncharacterized protein n=1 Tax=Bauhinia variegata TaxID=167791 RepID=A0ACB9P6C4_BAUVA|nr:hypothetical protein L6164_011524 [Bauhinia variegata]